MQSWFDHAQDGDPDKRSVRLAQIIFLAVNAIVGFRERYLRKLEEEIMSDVRKVSQLPGVSTADLNRLLPTVYDAATCYHAAKWKSCLWETWVEWWWKLSLGSIRLYRVYSIKRTTHEQQVEQANAMFVLVLLTLSPFIIIGSLILLFLFVIPIPTYSALVTGDLYGIISVWIIVSILQSMLHRCLPYRYLGFALFIESCLGIAVLHTVSAWSPSIKQGWHTFDKSIPTKYRDLVPVVHPVEVLLIVVWFVTLCCIIRFFARIANYIGFQLSDGRQFPGYSPAAQKSAALILGFLSVSHGLAEWERELPDKNATNSKVLSAKLPTHDVRFDTDHVLSDMVYQIHKYWKVAMRSSGTPAGERMAQDASRIQYFLEYQHLKCMLGGANYIKLREAMVTALIQSADGNWHLIGKDEAYEPVVMTTRWKIFLRRLISIALPIAGAILVSLFARHIPSLYIQSIFLLCLGFAGLQIIGLIDPEALARLDLATKVTGVFKR